MRSLPSDFIAAINADDAPVSMLVLKLESGDIKFSDGLYGEGIPYIESISEEQDGGSFENYLSRGNLETCKLSVTLIYSDLSKSTIHSVISELQSMSAGNLRCRAELWKKFVDIDGNDTCLPLLWNVYAVQDNSENFACREDQMLFPLELITLPGSENQKLSITNDQEKSYDYVIGKAEGLSLQLMEEESSKWTELLGDADGNEVTEEYTGLIRVKDASKLHSGYHLINGEYVYLSSASAGYMSLSQRGSSLTEAQKHSNGSRIFPFGSVFKYAVCSGPVGSLEKLRTSNEIDIYDEDGDGDITEYRDLYSGSNEILKPLLNPAQVWFNERMPFLYKDQELEIEDKPFFGLFSGFSSAIDVKNPQDVNKKDGKSSIDIKFLNFSLVTGTEYGYQINHLPLPSMSGDGSSYYASDNIGNGHITITQYHGNDQDAGREVTVHGTADIGENFWCSIGLEAGNQENYYKYTGISYPAISFPEVYAHYMRVTLNIYMVWPSGAQVLWRSFSIGSVFTSGYTYPDTWGFSSPGILLEPGDNSYLFKYEIVVNEKDSPSSYVRIRQSWYTIVDGKLQFFNGMALYTQYYKTKPSAYLSSGFNKNLSNRGTFVSAKAKIKGTLRNTDSKATGTIKIFDDSVEKHSSSITNGASFDVTIDLDCNSWINLFFKNVKILVSLDSLSGKITDGSAGIDLDGGIQWLLTYNSTTLDGLQVNYSDTLYVDAISTYGQDWTPARAVQYLAANHTSWAGLIDTDSFDDRHDEFTAAGHFLNGTISGSLGSQDAIRTILKEGLAGLNYPLGKITMYSYLTDLAATVPIKSLMSVVRPDRESLPNRGFMQSANESRSNRIFFRWNKNLSTGKYDGNAMKSDGTVFLNDQVVTFDLVKSDIIGNSVANFLWNLWRYGYIIQDCEYPAEALAIEKHDLITSFSMADNDATANFIVVSCFQAHESAKARRGLSAKIVMFKR